MIATWTLERFKSVYERINLEFAPLTIFAGANSSGKSTLIQSILLTTQTLQSPVKSRPVILNGHIIRLGTFDDVVSSNSESDSILIGFQLLASNKKDDASVTNLPPGYYLPRLSRMITSLDCHYVFSARGTEKQRDVLQLQPRLEESRIRVGFKVDDHSNEEEVLIRRSSKTIRERLAQYQLSRKSLQLAELSALDFEVIKPTRIKRLRRFLGLPATGRPAGATLEHFLPGRIPIVFDAIEEQSRQLVMALTSPDEFRYSRVEIKTEIEAALAGTFKKVILQTFEDFASELESGTLASELRITPSARRKLSSAITGLKGEFSLHAYRRWFDLPASLRRVLALKFADKSSELQKAIRGDRPPEYTIAYAPLPDFSEAAVNFTQNFFARMVKYLGPLRDEPKPVYPLAGATDPKDIGFRGEHTAAVLEVHRNTTIEYIPSEQMGRGYESYTPVSASLSDAVLNWLSYMGVASDVETSDKGKLGHELKVAVSGDTALHDLTHVGVGVSQVLPILVLSLLAESGSSLVFEQPELHLHPRVQTRLADFFVSMTMLNKQCIVETHSEYLINRLRYQTAISEGDEVSNKVIMYFVEKESGHSKYRSIRINKFGVIEDWPRGFFDENEETATSILRAGMEKRKKEIKKRNA